MKCIDHIIKRSFFSSMPQEVTVFMDPMRPTGAFEQQIKTYPRFTTFPPPSSSVA